MIKLVRQVYFDYLVIRQHSNSQTLIFAESDWILMTLRTYPSGEVSHYLVTEDP